MIELNAQQLASHAHELTLREFIKKDSINFKFPAGFNTIPLIEECRALNALDVSDPDNFDLMYDIAIQMLVGKATVVEFRDKDDQMKEAAVFVIANRYQNLRGIPIIDEYPILINWLVEYVAGYLGKKFPRSLKDCLDSMSGRKEPMKSKQSQ